MRWSLDYAEVPAPTHPETLQLSQGSARRGAPLPALPATQRRGFPGPLFSGWTTQPYGPQGGSIVRPQLELVTEAAAVDYRHADYRFLDTAI